MRDQSSWLGRNALHAPAMQVVDLSVTTSIRVRRLVFGVNHVPVECISDF
jgi:hypothetical protein